ncbi:alpha/beta hydrolase [Aphanizomenon sp. UHCC 0183]|nr:alpha/beta hydrolase [Aphanizomenon sp. UHCC 0183]
MVSGQLSNYYPLPITHYPLPITHYLLPISNTEKCLRHRYQLDSTLL